MTDRAAAMTNDAEQTAGGLAVHDLHKSFLLGGDRVEVLRGASFELPDGEALVLTGPSGSGKSTLLHIVGTLDSPSSGSIEIGGLDPSRLPEPELARFRNTTIGFVFQDAHLLPQYTVLENVMLPAWAHAGRARGASSWARELLERVGLAHRIAHRPAELSGGERQRAAVARALINRPRLLLCDEPTGSLDGNTAATIGSLLFELHRLQSNMLLVVTHSLTLAERFERRLELREGRCVEI